MADMRGRGGAVSTCRVHPRNCSSEREGRNGCELSGLPDSGRNEGRGRGYHELMCPAGRWQKREGRGEVLRAVLGWKMRGMEGMSRHNLSEVARIWLT